MGKRYYCEYCERSFIDDVESRKKHIKSMNHENLRRQHYSNFRDLKTLVREERSKLPCKRFRNSGQCPFNANCSYSHYSEGELRNFELIVYQEENDVQELPNIEDWLNGRHLEKELKPPIIFSDEPVRIFNYHLPPSLIPATKQQILNCKFSEWG